MFRFGPVALCSYPTSALNPPRLGQISMEMTAVKMSCVGGGCTCTSLMFMCVVHVHEECIQKLRTWNKRFGSQNIEIR